MGTGNVIWYTDTSPVEIDLICLFILFLSLYLNEKKVMHLLIAPVWNNPVYLDSYRATFIFLEMDGRMEYAITYTNKTEWGHKPFFFNR